MSESPALRFKVDFPPELLGRALEWEDPQITSWHLRKYLKGRAGFKKEEGED